MNKKLGAIILGATILSGCSTANYTSDARASHPIKDYLNQPSYDSRPVNNKGTKIKFVYRHPDGRFEWSPKEATEEQAKEFYSNRGRNTKWTSTPLPETNPSKPKAPR